MKATGIVLAAAALFAQAVVMAETLEEVNARLSAIGAEQIDLGDEAKDESAAIERQFRSGKLDTPKMKELRRQIDMLQRTLKATEDELRAAFEEIPEVKEAMEKLGTKTSRLKELQTERGRLLMLRKELTAAKDKGGEAAPATEAKGE